VRTAFGGAPGLHGYVRRWHRLPRTVTSERLLAMPCFAEQDVPKCEMSVRILSANDPIDSEASTSRMCRRASLCNIVGTIFDLCAIRLVLDLGTSWPFTPRSQALIFMAELRPQ
jgi:hypothetical protein